MQRFQIDDDPQCRSYRLRWVMHYTNGVVKRGMWNNSVDGCPHTSAWMQTRTGLLLAQVEAQCMVKATTRVVAECDGHEFKMFQWDGSVVFNASANGGASQQQEAQITGMKMHTSNSMTTVYCHGLIEVTDTEQIFDDSTFHYGRL
jgi:hypothetical protein